jgi:hypothetical protein
MINRVSRGCWITWLGYGLEGTRLEWDARGVWCGCDSLEESPLSFNLHGFVMECLKCVWNSSLSVAHGEEEVGSHGLAKAHL